MSRLKDPAAVRKIARKSLFEGLDRMCEGAIIVDREARIVWISDKYAQRLNLASAAEAAGRVVEDGLVDGGRDVGDGVQHAAEDSATLRSLHPR